ncbi:MAG: DNA replication/repair protein RecF [Gemmatimonadota bacterium]
MSSFEARRAGAAQGDPETCLARLSLHDYRNFEELDCEFPAAGVAIVGPNGSGKTNLLEAIYYLQIFRSFRGARDRELIRFGEDVFRVEASLSAPRRVELAAAYQRSRRRKKIEVDGREAERLTEAIGALGAVVFRLQDVEIIRGSPGVRRRFLDILLSLVVPGYVQALQRYRAVLGQRNGALRDGVEPALLEAWTEGLVPCGARVMEARASWVAERSASFREYYAAISAGTPAGLAYEPSVGRSLGGVGDAADSPGAEAGSQPGAPPRGDADLRSEEGAPGEGDARWEELLRRALHACEERDRRRGQTLVGPHRDELAFRIFDERGGSEPVSRNLRTYGSSGQQRTAALALRLTETDTLREKLGREPVYLLDDVFAELDEERSRRLLELLDEGRSGQVILTLPKPGEVSLRGGSLHRWRIRNGRLWQ